MSRRDGRAETPPGARGASRAAKTERAAGDAHRNRRRRAPGDHALAGFDDEKIAAAREAVLDRVRRSFRASLNEADVEDAAQEAWAAVLAEQRDTPIRDLAAFVAEIGWRSARGVTRRPRPVTLDPEDSALLDREDLGSSPLDRIERRAALARIVEAVQQLSEAQREAFRLWFVDEMEAVDAAKELGISRSAYFKRLTAAKARLEGALNLDDHHFARTQRRLISDYVAGIAEGRARLRAEKLIAADPQAAAMAREIRRAHEAGAAVLPVLFLNGHADGDVVAPAAGLVEKLRESISGWFGRGADAADVVAAPALASGGVRGAGAVGAGLMAKAFGGLGAGGVALGCIGGGAVITVACVATGLVSLPGESTERHADTRPQIQRSPPAARVSARVVEAVAAKSQAPVAVQPAQAHQPSVPDVPTEEPPAPVSDAEPVLEPAAPADVQEFGVEAAAVPAQGGSPGDGDGASAVRQEFGP